MRHWLCAVSAAALLASGPAFAADLGHGPPPAPVPPPPPVFSWTGFYIGAEVGGAWARNTDSELYLNGVPNGDTAGSNPSGVIGGGLVGFNYQLGSVVFGLEGDAEGSDLKATGIYTLAAPDSVTSNTDFQGSIRGRLGVAVDRWLVYGTGGVAFAHTQYDYNCVGCFPQTSESFDNTRTGWTLGAGIEYAFTNNWIGRVEYRYADFGHQTDNVTMWNLQERQRLTENIVQVGLLYKFGAPPPPPPPPVSARY